MQSKSGWLIACLCLLTAAAAGADDAASTSVSSQELANEDRIAELERTVAVLAEELERTRMDVTVPENPELVSSYGMGPAASKVYGMARGLSIGGYGQAYYTNFVTDKTTVVDESTGAVSTRTENNTMDFLRAVLYVGYKFTDSIVFNSEIEIEHTDEISLEFATLDFLWKDYLNAKTGLMLLPVGWLNQMHEPTFYYGVNRPDVERYLIPTTWRENGFGIFGSFGELVHYKLFGVNGMDGSGFSTSGIRGGRQNGAEALANDLAAVGRLDFTPIPGLVLGGSFYVGNSGQDQGSNPAALTTLFDVHAQWDWRNLHLRGLYTMVFIDDAADLSTSINGGTPPAFSVAETMLGGYAEVAYDVWHWFERSDRALEPFYRFEYYDTQADVPSGFSPDRTKRIRSHTVGIQFEPIPNVVLKADYRNRNPEDGEIADEFNLGIGYVF